MAFKRSTLVTINPLVQGFKRYLSGLEELYVIAPKFPALLVVPDALEREFVGLANIVAGLWASVYSPDKTYEARNFQLKDESIDLTYVR